MAIKISGTTVIDNSQNITNAGIVTATSFTGDGSQLTNLPGGGGNTLEATASGTLADGSKVIVNTDGTVSVVAQTETTGPGAVGSGSFTGDTDATTYVSSVYDPDTQKLIVVYADEGASFSGGGGPLRAVVATVSGTSISFGSPSTLSGNTVRYTSVAYDSTNDKVVIAYQDQSASGVGKAVVATVSGTSISFGTPVTFSGTDVADFSSITYDSNAQKIVIAYREYGSGYGGVGNGRAIVGTVSGTSISFGSSTIFAAGSGGASHISLVYHSTAQKVVLTCSDDTNSGYPTSRVGTISGTSISFGAAVVINSASGTYVRSLYDPDTEKVIVAYVNYSNSSYGTAKVGTVSGTSISFGSASVFNAGSTVTIAMAYDANTQKSIICFSDRGNSDKGTFVSGTVSGTSITFSSETIFTDEGTWDTAPVYDSSAQKVAVFHTLTGSSRAATSKIISTTGFSIPQIGSATVFESARSEYIAATYDSTNQKVVIAYRDDGNSQYGTAIVGTVSGTSISFGTPTVYNSSRTDHNEIVNDPSNGKVVVAYMDNGSANNYGTARVGTVSGTSISFGSPVVFESDSTGSISGVYDPDTQKIVFAFTTGNPSMARAIVGTVSGTSISFGTSADFNSGNSINRTSIAYDTTNNKVVIAYMDQAPNYRGKAVVGTVSGTSISFGTPNTFSFDESTVMSIVNDPINGKLVIAWKDQWPPAYGQAVVATVSGTSISFGSTTTFEYAAVEQMATIYETSSGKIVIVYRDEGNSNYGTAVVGTISGTSISFDTPFVFKTSRTQYVHATIYDPDSDKIVSSFCDYGNSLYGTTVVFTPFTISNNLTSENFIGISDGAYSDGQTATIQLTGAVDDAQSSLTPGQAYYVQNDGTLSETADSPSVFAGTALASTKLIVRG
mgnify:CR=1 FL=1